MVLVSFKLFGKFLYRTFSETDLSWRCMFVVKRWDALGRSANVHTCKRNSQRQLVWYTFSYLYPMVFKWYKSQGFLWTIVHRGLWNANVSHKTAVPYTWGYLWAKVRTVRNLVLFPLVFLCFKTSFWLIRISEDGSQNWEKV